MISSLKDLPQNGRFGGKAHPLGVLAQKGFAVPEAFCFDEEFFDDFLGCNRIPHDLPSAWKRGHRLRDKILAGKFSSRQQRELSKIFSSLCVSDNALIVRSSSGLEDGTLTSAAGVFDSFQGIQSLDQLHTAVRQCFASAYSDRALGFGMEHAAQQRPSMAVLVQRWVPGVLSGVCFTCNTQNGSTDSLVVNWVEGPCRALVDGSVSGHLSVFEKGARGSGPIAPFLPEFERVEAVFGVPQDIEWTFDGTQLWILQSRPVTTLKVTPRADDLPRTDEGWAPLPFRRPLRPLEVEAALRANAGDLAVANELGISYLIELRSWRGHLFERPVKLDASRAVDFIPTVVEYLAAETDVYHDLALPPILSLQKTMREVFRNPTSARVQGLLAVALQHAELSAKLHWKAVWGLAYVEPWDPRIGGLKRDLPELFERFSSSEVFDLIYTPTLKSAMRALVARAGSIARDSRPLRAAFEAIASDQLLFHRLPSVRGGRRVLAIVGQLVRLAGPTQLEGDWRDPFALPSSVRPWAWLAEVRMQLAGTRGPRETESALLSRRGRLERRLLADLPPTKRNQAVRNLAKARRAFQTREEHSVFFDASKFGFFLTAAHLVGQVLVSSGKLADREEVFYFQTAELEAALAGEVLNTQTLQGRKHGYAESRTYQFSAPLRPAAPATAESADEFPGQATMDRAVSGSVWFPDQSYPETGGIVLVVADERSINLFSYLSRIDAVVFDQGSPYSHLAITAREYGIPALYGTKNAARLLENGAPVVVDGGRGKLMRVKA